MPTPNLRLPAVAKKIGKSIWSVRLMIYRGELPVYKIGGTWHADEQELDTWLAARHRPGRATRLPDVRVPA